jgi:hypothetical protein
MSFARPIYGTFASDTHCVCTPETPPTVGLSLLQQVIGLLRSTIDKFYPRAAVNAPFTARMSARGYLPAELVTRLIWIKRYIGVQFDPTSAIHRSQLKDIYLENLCEWRNDKLFADEPPSS